MTRRYYGLPPGHHIGPGPCPECGGCRREMDRVEGLPIYACLNVCGQQPGAIELGRIQELANRIAGTARLAEEVLWDESQRETGS